MAALASAGYDRRSTLSETEIGMRASLTSSLFMSLILGAAVGCNTAETSLSTGTEGASSGGESSTGGSSPTTSSTGSAGTTTTEGSGSATGSTSGDPTTTTTTGEPGSTSAVGTTTDAGSTTEAASTSGGPGSSSDTGGGSTGDPGLCLIAPGDDACTTCNKNNCCDQVLACAADEKCVCFFGCVNNGMMPVQCAQLCMVGQPGQNPAIAGLFECTNANCGDEC